MAESNNQNPQPETAVEQVSEALEKNVPDTAGDPAQEESTIGTGTSMALGCVAGTIVLIVFGLLFLLISSFF